MLVVLVCLVLVCLVLADPSQVRPDRRFVHRARNAQGPGEGPAAHRVVQAAKVGMHPGTTSRQHRADVRGEDDIALLPDHHHPQQP